MKTNTDLSDNNIPKSLFGGFFYVILAGREQASGHLENWYIF